MTKAQKAEREDSIVKLREWIKPGDTVHTILDHVSASGMMRAIRVVVPTCHEGQTDFLHPNYAVGQALGLRHWKLNGREQDALKMEGCGMDMGFQLVYRLSYALYPTYACLGDKCPSPNHGNARRNGEQVEAEHSDGYALRHRWL